MSLLPSKLTDTSERRLIKVLMSLIELFAKFKPPSFVSFSRGVILVILLFPKSINRSSVSWPMFPRTVI